MTVYNSQQQKLLRRKMKEIAKLSGVESVGFFAVCKSKDGTTLDSGTYTVEAKNKTSKGYQSIKALVNAVVATLAQEAKIPVIKKLDE